jgi:hypothetical protein
VLLMNICVPLIDMGTQPPVFGRKDDKETSTRRVSEPQDAELRRHRANAAAQRTTVTCAKQGPR